MDEIAPRRIEPGLRSETGSQINKATERVLRVLSAFEAEPRASRGVSELAAQLGMTKNMVFRALATLVGEGYLVRDPSGSRYALGYRLFELRRAEGEPDLRVLCAPYLRRMFELTGETITLSVPVGFSSVVIDGIEGSHPVVTRLMYGRSIPLHAGPGSRAILSFLSDDEIEAFLAAKSPLEKLTETTITEPEALWREIHAVRSRGYAIGYGDHVPNSAAVAFPVLGVDRRPHGAVAVGAPDLERGWKRLQGFIPALKEIMAGLDARAPLLGAMPSLVGSV